MTGQTNLDQLISSMSPSLGDTDYVFVTIPKATPGAFSDLEALSTFQEAEGLSMILEKSKADRAGLSYEGIFNCITLNIHSSLNAVGLTAAVSAKLTTEGISANVVAAYYHDHIFVPKARATDALHALTTLSQKQ